MKDKTVARAFGKVLREARIARGLSQEDLAADAEIDRTYPSLLERGRRVPTLTVFLRLCRPLRCTPVDLVRATLVGLSRVGALPSAITTDAFPLVIADPPTIAPARPRGAK
jgi:transcriptional regulator with XRE-family HTH domain